MVQQDNKNHQNIFGISNNQMSQGQNINQNAYLHPAYLNI